MGVSEMPRYRWPNGGGSPDWMSGAIAMIATALLFASAFLAMTHVREMRERSSPQAEPQPRIVALPAPAPATPPRVERITRRAAPAVRMTPQQVAPPTVAPAQAAPPPRSAPRDSTANGHPTAPPVPASSLTELRPRIFPPPPPAGRMLGTPPSPAGVTIHNKKLSLQQMDSMDNATMAKLAEYARTHPETPAERGAQPNGPHPPPLHNGPGGGAGPGTMSLGGASIPVPFLSPGPSPAQRKRDSALDADYQRRLRALESRALLKRDSTRADSLRSDSIARAKRRP